jgi:hypothetical protein
MGVGRYEDKCPGGIIGKDGGGDGQEETAEGFVFGCH